MNLKETLGEALNPNINNMKTQFKTDLTGKKILYLTLNKKWFDLHVSEVKPVDYREIKPYWERRLYTEHSDINLDIHLLSKHFDYVVGVNGAHFGKGMPMFLAPFIKTDIGLSDPALCDDKEPTERFRIFRGGIIETINIK